MLGYVITALIAIVVSATVTYFVTSSVLKNSASSKIGNAENKAREIIDEALKTAETKKRASMTSWAR